MTITTEDDYQKALAVLEQVFDAEEGTNDYLVLTLMEQIIAEYEDSHYPVEECSPQEVVELIMKEHGLNKKEFGEAVGISSSRVTEFMNATRKLSVKQAKAINEKFRVSLDVLLEAPSKKAVSKSVSLVTDMSRMIRKYKKPVAAKYSFKGSVLQENVPPYTPSSKWQLIA